MYNTYSYVSPNTVSGCRIFFYLISFDFQHNLFTANSKYLPQLMLLNKLAWFDTHGVTHKYNVGAPMINVIKNNTDFSVL